MDLVRFHISPSGVSFVLDREKCFCYDGFVGRPAGAAFFFTNYLRMDCDFPLAFSFQLGYYVLALRKQEC